jgi:hypothetical protein
MDIFQKLYEIENETGGDVSGIKKLIDSGQLTIASSIPQPDPKEAVRNIELINSFMAKYPPGKADGGMLVKPSEDGSRPGYANPNPKVATKEFIEQRDKGKGIPIVREYLRKVLRRKDSINFKDIADIKNKAGLPKNAKIDSDISRLINTEEFKDKVTTDLKKKQLGQTETFRNILRDIKKTIPKGNKQFINVSYIAKKYEIPGKPDSGGFYRVLQEPEFADTFVGLTQDTRSNPQIIRFAEEFERLYEISDVDEDFFRQLAINIYGNDKPRTIRAVGADASKYAEFLYGVREVTDVNGNKLKLPNVEKRGDYLFELIDETLALQEGEKGKVKPITYDQGIVRDRMFAIRDGLLGLKEGQTELQRTNIKKLLKKGYNLDEVAGLAATHEIAPGYTELVQGLKKKINADKMVKIDKPFSRIFEQVITGQKPTKGYKYGNKFYQNINEVVKLYNKDAAAYGKKYGIDVPLIEYKPGKKINPKNFLPNFKYLSPEAKANVQDLARQGIGVRTGAVTMSQMEKGLKEGSPLFKKLMKFCPKSNGGEAGVCTIQEAMDGLVSESKQLQSGNMNDAQAKKTAQKIRAVTRVGTGSTLAGLLGPYGVAGEVVIDGAIMANRMLDSGDTYKQALSKSLIKYAMPTADRKKLEKETDLNTMILGSDTSGLAADYADALKKDEDLKQKYENYLRVNQEDMSSLQDPYSSGSTPMFSIGDKNKAERELIQALERAEPTYGKSIYETMKFGSPEQQAFAAKQEVFDAQKMQNRMDYDKKILGPLKDLFGTGFYSPEQLKQLELKADRDTKAIGQIPDEFKTQQIADFGGVANLAKGGRAGFKLGSLRKGLLSLIDDSVKKTPKDTTSDLDALIKKTLDEDLFDKKDRIVDSINISEAKKRKNYPYNMQVFEEPKNLDFYRAIKESNFRTKTGPFFDRTKKAGGGLLKQAGDRSGPPPESGPNSQGLQGLLNRVKKI